MNGKTEKIIKKLSPEMQQGYNCEFARDPHYSNAFYEWGKDRIYDLDLARDAGIITKEEWQEVYDDLFDGWVCGKIGECPEIKRWDRFWESLAYTGKE